MACASAAGRLSCMHGKLEINSGSYGYPAECAVVVPVGEIISIGTAYWTDVSLYLGQSESAKNDCLKPADSV